MEPAGRLTSLDAFRGFTIAAMVLVNKPGDWSNLYPQLAHAKWHGWTFTDLIFPFFLFIGGVSMALSLGRLAAAGANKPQLLARLARRAALICHVRYRLIHVAQEVVCKSLKTRIFGERFCSLI